MWVLEIKHTSAKIYVTNTSSSYQLIFNSNFVILLVSELNLNSLLLKQIAILEEIKLQYFSSKIQSQIFCIFIFGTMCISSAFTKFGEMSPTVIKLRYPVYYYNLAQYY